jgi:hypothetical protein
MGFVTIKRIRQPIETWGIFESIVYVVLIGILTCTAAGTALAFLPVVLPGELTSGPLVATARTIALVIATFFLAFAARKTDRREAGWFVYPMLLLTGAKIIFVDFPQGRPQTLFAALACYGIALIVVPRLLRRSPIPGVPQVTTSARESSERSSADVMVTPGPRRV